MSRVVEIRSYNLTPGARARFHLLMSEQSLPMLQRWNIDVVAFGPSIHDEDSYYLIRAYTSLEELQQSEDAFYGSAEWRHGPREAVLACIESYTTVVLSINDDALHALRQSL